MLHVPRFFIMALFFLLMGSPAAAQDIPVCMERAGILLNPLVHPQARCMELVAADGEHGELAFTALAVAPDGTLYATRPLYGELLRLTDSNNDGLPEQIDVIADDLTLPNALFYHEEALYVAGGAHIYRWQDETLRVLVDDLPAEGGIWTGGLAIVDDRLYVGTGAPCDACVWDEPERGAILSFALDGSDRRRVAQGFRQPMGLLPGEGFLWVTDSARAGLMETPWLDELNQVALDGEVQHFGFPYCVGAENTPDIAPGDFDCQSAVAPFMAFDTHSLPIAMQYYRDDAFPFFKDKLLMLLAGAPGRPDIRGFELIAINLNGGENQIVIDSLIPYEGINFTAGLPVTYTLPGYRNPDAVLLNQRDSGLYPHQVYGLAVSPEGWVYFSQGGGRIIALRPESRAAE